jgi:hypothetical protein
MLALVCRAVPCRAVQRFGPAVQLQCSELSRLEKPVVQIRAGKRKRNLGREQQLLLHSKWVLREVGGAPDREP